MNETPDPRLEPTREILLAEIRGLAAAQSARFDGIEREQNTMREWMGRLSEAIDRQVTVTSKFMGLEIRQAQTESNVKDITLDLHTLQGEVQTIKQDNVKTAMIRGFVVAVFTSIVTAVLMTMVQNILGQTPSAIHIEPTVHH